MDSLSVLSVVTPAIAVLKRSKALTERNWPLANPALCFLALRFLEIARAVKPKFS
jgi:hypothetical protein